MTDKKEINCVTEEMVEEMKLFLEDLTRLRNKYKKKITDRQICIVLMHFERALWKHDIKKELND